MAAQNHSSRRTPAGRFAIISIALGIVLCAYSAPIQPAKVSAAARTQIGVTVSYDPAYRSIAYPGGDVPKATGVCADVIVRALRENGVDLQKELHEDMTASFRAYPQKWGLTKPDANIDHRRVPNLMTWFQRKGYSQTPSAKAGDFAAGDIVTWDLGHGVTHIGIISDRRSARGVPLVIHNIGAGAKEEDTLFLYRVLGHYRFK